MDMRLINWYTEYHINGKCPVTDALLMAMAKLYSTQKSFRASKGWLEKFKKRNVNIFRHVNKMIKNNAL